MTNNFKSPTPSTIDVASIVVEGCEIAYEHNPAKAYSREAWKAIWIEPDTEKELSGSGATARVAFTRLMNKIYIYLFKKAWGSNPL